MESSLPSEPNEETLMLLKTDEIQSLFKAYENPESDGHKVKRILHKG